MIESSFIFSVRIDLIDSPQLLKKIENLCQNNEKEYISNVNIKAMNLAYDKPEIFKFFNNAYINFIDGDGINLGLWLLGRKTGPKITYDWWIWDLARMSELKGLSWFILGDEQSVLETAILKLSVKYPRLKIAGYINGFFAEEGLNDNDIVNKINDSNANILLLGMGMPYQELWLSKNWKEINANVALTGGAFIKFLANVIPSTPLFFRRNKMEWLYRFLINPPYYFKRYFFGIPTFIFRIIMEKLKIKIGHQG